MCIRYSYAKFIREVENGEIIVIENNEIKSIKPSLKKNLGLAYLNTYILVCPDSIIEGKCAYEFRKRFGEELAKESDIEADMIVPVPDLQKIK